MNILLVRSDGKALFLPAAFSLQGCPVAVLRWLGSPVSEELTELNCSTAMIGIEAQAVLDEISKVGFCAIDAAGILRPTQWKRSIQAAIRNCKRSAYTE